MKLSFWKNKPVQINKDNDNECTQILSNNELLNKINDEITNSTFQLDYSILNIDDLCAANDKLDNMISFINSHYVTCDDDIYKLMYTPSLLKFYCQDSIIIEFYPKSNKRIIGYIIGKRTELSLAAHNNNLKCLEVNFLCVIPKLRNMGLSSYMINCLSKESINKYNIAIAHYTIASKIKSPYFGKKKFYHRLINIQKLDDNDFFTSNTDLNIYKKVYNTFSYNLDFNNKYNISMIHNDKTHTLPNNVGDGKDTDLINVLYNKYIDYAKKSYDIYETITLQEFENTFNNDSFYHFMLRKKESKDIISYICMFRLDTFNSQKNTGYKAGYLYYMFFNNDLKKENVIEYINEFIYINNIFDVITFTDIFNFDYNNIKCISGTGLLRYYLFNMNCNSIENSKNGLITI